MTEKKSNNPNDRDKSADEVFVQQTLTAHFQDTPAPNPEFVEQLSAQLDEAFLSMDDSVSGGSTLVTSDVDAWPEQLAKPSEIRTASRRSMPRWVGGVIAATAMLAVFAVWSSQPAFSWAEMLDALKRQPWVQTDAGRTSSWFSSSSRIFARRNTTETVLENRKEGSVRNFVKRDGRVYEGQDPSLVSRTFERDLTTWLTTGLFDPNVSADQADWNVISQSSRYLDDESGRWIELTVVFESANRDTFTAVFTMDVKTKLPANCRVHPGSMVASSEDRSDSSQWRNLSFDYPNEGPRDLHDLGVGRHVPVVAFREPSVNINRHKIQKSDPVKLENKQLAKAVDPFTLPDSPDKDLSDTFDLKPKQNQAGKIAKNRSVAESTDATDALTKAIATKVAPLPIAPVVPIPKASLAMTSRIDQLVDQLWDEKEIEPATEATDEEFLRRVYLDVIGRVPTVTEYDQFFALDQGSRRRELVDQLLDSREHALHMGGIWKRVLVPDDETAISRLGGSGKLEQWLSKSFSDNKPYDKLVRELLLAEGRVNESGPLLFYAAAKLNAEELAARTSRTFLGMRMECAECHDHPFDDWSQEDFWGLAAYFAQISRPKGKIEMVSPVLRVHDAAFGDVTLPESDVVVAPKLPSGHANVNAMSNAAVVELQTAEIEGASRREELADWITHPQNTRFTQATVNRVWGHLFGVGLVDPVDDMGSHNIPTSPEILDQLGRYFVQSNFDLRELMRVMINSKAYQLTSRNSGVDSAAGVNLENFGRMSLKPLTAEQLYDCLATSTGRSDLGKSVAAPMNFGVNIDRFSDPGRAAFLAMFRTSIDQRTDYQAGIPQALSLMNGPLISTATSDAPKGILRSLSAPFFSDEVRIEKLFIATLSRKPTPEELERYTQLLKDQPKDAAKHEILGDILWVLLNTAEFTMNH